MTESTPSLRLTIAVSICLAVGATLAVVVAALERSAPESRSRPSVVQYDVGENVPLPAPTAAYVGSATPHPIAAAQVAAAAALTDRQLVRTAEAFSEAAQDDPSRLPALAALYHHPRFDDPELAMAFHPLVASDDPRLGPLALARYRTYSARGGDSWVQVDLVFPLIARHGGGKGLAFLRRALRAPSTANPAFEALAHATHPDAVKLAVAALQRSDDRFYLSEEAIERVVAAQCKRGGVDTVEAFERLADRTEATQTRHGIVAGLIEAATPKQFDHLLWNRTITPQQFLAVAAGVAYSRTVNAAQQDYLRARLIKLLPHTLHGPTALRIVRNSTLYKTTATLQALRTLLPTAAGDQRRDIQDTIKKVLE